MANIDEYVWRETTPEDRYECARCDDTGCAACAGVQVSTVVPIERDIGGDYSERIITLSLHCVGRVWPKGECCLDITVTSVTDDIGGQIVGEPRDLNPSELIDVEDALIDVAVRKGVVK